ncbi:MAG: hypothetical protein PVG39_12535 [Desulfobacteraceae bacterium]|jgi:hypothetical protein
MSEAVQKKGFSYFQIITGMLSRPGHFYENNLSDRDMKTPAFFLLISAAFFVSASLTVIKGNIVISAGILSVNALVMPLITAAISMCFIRIFTGGSVRFIRIFTIHAFAGGTVLLAAWIPMITWITEPWKWILIITGYVRGCNMTYLQAAIISALTAGFIIYGFRFLINTVS